MGSHAYERGIALDRERYEELHRELVARGQVAEGGQGGEFAAGLRDRILALAAGRREAELERLRATERAVAAGLAALSAGMSPRDAWRTVMALGYAVDGRDEPASPGSAAAHAGEPLGGPGVAEE